jgi:CrcB protein
MQAYLIVFFGAGLGGALRHGVNVLVVRALGIEFPYGTLAVNILGSLIRAGPRVLTLERTTQKTLG